MCILANPKFNFFSGEGRAPDSPPNSRVRRSWGL